MSFSSKCANTHKSVTSLGQNVSVILWIVYILGILEQFGTQNYTWRFDIAQKSL